MDLLNRTPPLPRLPAPLVPLSLALALALAASPAAAIEIFSPGPLSQAHASVDGLKNCTKCHEAGDKLSAKKCLDCHGELEPRLAAGKGLHGRLSAEEKASCQRCHKEHRGKDRAPVDWGEGGRDGFDHARTGFALRGAHAKAECKSCHEPRRIVDAVARKLLQEKGRKTYLGLPTTCASCHFDEHRGQLGDACQDCHSEEKFAPARGFDHDESDYPLRGKHQDVACAECHPGETDTTTPDDAFPAPKTRSFVRYEPVAHASCLDCHADPHGGSFGNQCEKCHTVDGWQIIQKNVEERSFHDKFAFRLLGEHARVPCRSCHGPFPGEKARFKGLPHELCTDCHVDAHVGQLGDGRQPPRCESCHSVEGFLPPRFELEEHAKTRYPLEGAHRAASCRGCHAEDRSLRAKIPASVRRFLDRRSRKDLFSLARLELGKKAERCVNCHEDPHGGQFAARVKKSGCADCHVVESFYAVRFDHDRESRFPLTGKHRTAACASCHTPSKKGGPVRYAPLPLDCEGCHRDVHLGQFAERDPPRGCADCHTTETFASLVNFDHDDPAWSAFPLRGRHRQVECARCHAETEVAPGLRAARYRPLPSSCEACHQDPHGVGWSEFAPGREEAPADAPSSADR